MAICTQTFKKVEVTISYVCQGADYEAGIGPLEWEVELYVLDATRSYKLRTLTRKVSDHELICILAES